MIDSQTIGGMLMSGLVFWAGGRALADSSSPYEQIAQRNAFGLRMPVAETHTPPPEPLPKLKLVGIITRQTEKWVLLRMQAVLAGPSWVKPSVIGLPDTTSLTQAAV